MTWVKVPDEHRPLFLAALPQDKRVLTLPMFGGLAAKVNGNMFGGLFGRSAIVRLSPSDQTEALALDGAGWFAPMGDGRVSKTSVQLPESVMEDPAELKDWLRRAFDHAVTLPPKVAKKPTAAKKPAAKKPTAAKKRSGATADRTGTKKAAAAKKPATRRPAAAKKPAAKKR